MSQQNYLHNWPMDSYNLNSQVADSYHYLMANSELQASSVKAVMLHYLKSQKDRLNRQAGALLWRASVIAVRRLQTD
jgi:hypothetical protein